MFSFSETIFHQAYLTKFDKACSLSACFGKTAFHQAYLTKFDKACSLSVCFRKTAFHQAYLTTAQAKPEFQKLDADPWTDESLQRAWTWLDSRPLVWKHRRGVCVCVWRFWAKAGGAAEQSAFEVLLFGLPYHDLCLFSSLPLRHETEAAEGAGPSGLRAETNALFECCNAGMGSKKIKYH